MYEFHGVEIVSNYLDDPNYEFQSPKTRHDNRAVRALRTGFNDPEAHDLADRIEGCRKGQRCSSLWCRTCRGRSAYGLTSRIRDHVESRFGNDHDAARDNLLFVTPLFDLVSVCDLPRVKQTMKKARDDFLALKRVFPELWWQGAFEFELIDFKALMEWDGANKGKRETLAALHDWDEKTNLNLCPTYVLVHAHFLIDLNGTKREDVTAWLSQRYNRAPCQVHWQGIQAGQSFEDLSRKIGSYPFKDRVQFNMSFQSQDYRHGKYFDNRELGNLVLLYDQIGGKGGMKMILIGSKSR